MIKTELIFSYLLAMFTVRCAFKLRSLQSKIISFQPVRTLSVSSTAKSDEKESGHSTGLEPPTLPAEEQKWIEILQQHSTKAPRLSVAEEIRTLIATSTGHGVISTNSLQFPGYPTGSVVAFQQDDDGLPFFSMSTMSAHTRDLGSDGKASLVVMANDFKTVAEGRVMMIGSITKVTEEEKKAALREKYLQRHKDSYWIDFGDFSYFKMADLVSVRYVGGFARAGSVTGEEYLAAKSDPLAPFAVHVVKHMNDDHEDSTVAMIQHYVGVPVSEAKIVSLDRLGLTVNCKLKFAGNGYSKIRLPFPREVTERKAVKDAIVAMTQASAPKT